MNVKIALRLGATALSLACATAFGFAQQRAPVPPVLQNYKPVTAERLKKPEDGDWLMVRRTYDGWGYSPLDRDHARQRRTAAARVGGLDRRQQRTRGGAHRQQRRDVRRHAGQSGHRPRRAVRPDPLAVPAAAAGRRDPPAPDQPRRRACSATRCSSPPVTRCSSRSTPEPDAKSGRRRSRRTGTATTCRSPRSSPTAR